MHGFAGVTALAFVDASVAVAPAAGMQATTKAAGKMTAALTARRMRWMESQSTSRRQWFTPGSPVTPRLLARPDGRSGGTSPAGARRRLQ